MEAAGSSSALISFTPITTALAEVLVIPVSPVYEGLATHYGVQYNGSIMGCMGEPYSSDNETIIAVGAVHNAEWPCGTQMRVCGLAGCIVGSRQDSCPGCGAYHLDLSEAGIMLACGDQAHVCRVGIEQVLLEYQAPETPAAGIQVIFRDVLAELEPIVNVSLVPPAVPIPIFHAGLAPVP
jgi:hypothetical protein